MHPLHLLNQAVEYFISVCSTHKDGGYQAPQPAFSLRAFQNSEKMSGIVRFTLRRGWTGAEGGSASRIRLRVRIRAGLVVNLSYQ